MANLLLIRDLCEKNRITFRELCRRVGRTESTLQTAMRRGTTNTTTLEMIAKELNVSPAIFFDGTSEIDAQSKDKEIKLLRELLAEKERIISLLMEERKRGK
ncbi:MAG: helix-turn-helix transcriptional regulator [Bacteroidales bacterium]|nr:helix-turn-helix transcriptional regulator [Bacteroidales bacterium]